MRKVVERVLAAMMVVTVMAGMTGCGASGGTGETGAGAADVKKAEGPKIEDIVWSVDEGVSDGKRAPLLSLTNNSDVTLVGFEINFTEKDGITDEERNGFFTDVKENFKFDDEHMAELREKGVSMHAKTERLTKPGESVSGVNLYYFQGIFYMRDMGHYSLVEPDIAVIDYVDGSTIYREYYDFKSDKYTMESSAVNALYWTSSELGKMIPKPEASVIKESVDYADHFSFDAYGLTMEEFNSYVAQCKEKGFTRDSTEHSGYYRAENAEGYEISANYNDDDCKMYFSLDAPDED